jgi:hypothetical protein
VGGGRRNQRVAALGRRLARELAFVQARLTPGTALGLHLTIWMLLLLIRVSVPGQPN